MTIPIELDHDSHQSLQGQISEQFQRLILCGRQKLGTSVPASCALLSNPAHHVALSSLFMIT